MVILSPQFPAATIKPIVLASKQLGALQYPISELAEGFTRGDFTLGTISDALAYSLLNVTYEICNQHCEQSEWLELRKSHPEIEFLRHSRNAASHGGKWSFKNGEPRRTAEWRGVRITDELEGKPYWEVGIEPGDILLLIWDVEQILIPHLNI